MVEFALVFPVAALLLLGIVVLGIVVMDQNALSTGVKAGARAAAICATSDSGQTLPDGTSCSNLDTYIKKQLATVGSASFSVSVPGGTWPTSCTVGNYVEVSASYQQPLYVPLVGHLLGNAATNTRTLTAHGEAPCEPQ